MEWKFWKRAMERSRHEEGGDADGVSAVVPAGNALAGGGNGSATSNTPPWLLLAGSPREILALQQVVGNQAVLRLLHPQQVPEPVATQDVSAALASASPERLSRRFLARLSRRSRS